MKLLLLYNRCFFGRLLWLGGKDCGVTSSRRPLYSIVVLTVYLCFINRTALSKIERKSLLCAGPFGTLGLPKYNKERLQKNIR